jgi:glycosyltransferase involved in cell wall biosynthesis
MTKLLTVFFFFICCIQGVGAYTYQVTMASMFRNTAPYLKEWIDYHLTVGVEHFWLYNDGSTDNFEEVVRPYKEQGLVDVYEWYDSNPDWVPRQIAAFQDAISRAKGTSKWIALIDQDEFIVPLQEGTIAECMDKHFLNEVAVYMNWRNFGTNEQVLTSQQNLLSHLLASSNKNHSRNCVGKTIFRPEYAEIHRMWSPHFCSLKQGAYYVNGSGGKTIKAVGDDLITDGKHHSNFIRVNHYAFRDEGYFRSVRLPRDSNPSLMIEMNEDFSLAPDYAILQMLKKYHPTEYQKYWVGPYDRKVKI